MNPRQRRGLLLLMLAGVLAIGVFAAVVTYVSNVHSEVGGLVPVLRLRDNLPPYAALTSQAIQPVSIPSKWAPATAVHSMDAVQGYVAATALKKGSYLQADMLMPPPELQPGQREVAILVDAETGVAGKITRGSIVDIYATFGKTQGQSGAQGMDRSTIVVANARILDVGNAESISGSNNSGSFTENKRVPVTFALSTRDALALVYTESFATKFRLALLAPGDNSTVAPGDRTFTLNDLPAAGGAPPAAGP
ncbi:MAG TPA: Flp pilus assembly protein CpaB [Acidimicrobiales bacterium]